MSITESIKNITWLGQSGFLLFFNKKTIVIDPYETSVSAIADIILITHPHWDHLSINDIEKFNNPNTIIITDQQSASKIEGNIKIINIWDELVIFGIKIKAVRAYNLDSQKPHLRKSNWLGFIISSGGTSIYHAGDTDLIPEMNDYDADIALVPVSGTYVMDVKQAVDAIKIIRPKVAIPMHYNPKLNRYYKIFPGAGTMDDAIAFCNDIKHICKPVLLNIFSDN